jgi:cytoskeletal protein CcmA (bactofilin family)
MGDPFSARFFGDVQAGNLVVESGAVVEGNMRSGGVNLLAS